MRIVQFCQLYPPAVYGGGEVLFFNYARELVKEGHEVNVITERLKGTPSFEKINGINIHRVGKPINYKGHLSMSFKDNFWFMLHSLKEGLRICKKADIIHSNTYAPSVSAHLVSFLLKIPHVISIFDVYSHGEFWKHWSNQEGVSKGLNLLGSILEKIILKFKPAIIHTISQASKKDLLKAKVRSPIKVVPCFIDLNEYKIKPVKTKNQFCYVGRHVFYKNVDTIIKTMPEILQKNPNVKFIVVGDGPKKKEWEALASRIGVKARVIFTGRVSQEEKLKIINESKFLVLPSLVEGFGIVLLEAWALGKQTLVSNVAPLNELVTKERGKIISALDNKEWAKQIIKSLNENKQVKYPKEFTKEVVIKELINLFKSIKI